jgi:hypothetical protein
MDDLELASVVGLLMGQIETALETGMLQENAQIVIRPIFTWPAGQLGVWIIVNCPN